MSLIKLQQDVSSRRSPPAVVVLSGQDSGLQNRAYWLVLGLAVGLGIAIRAFHVLSHDFPLNDGGLFFAMVRDLQASHYQLPAFTTYNLAGIPFGYSPLGFYLAGLLDDLTPLTLVDVFRWLPLTVSGLILIAFASLAQALLVSRTAVIVAVLAFGLLPRSFIWMVMGGGLTRSLGFLFGLISLRLLYAFYTERQWKYVPLISLAAGLTLLSHLGTAPFIAFSSLLFLLAYGRHRQAVLGSGIAAAITALVSAPWWYTVVQMHGIDPFLAAGATGGSIFGALRLQDLVHTLSVFGVGTAESVLAAVGMLAVLGFLLSLSRGDWLLPAWWISIVLLDARQGSTFAMVPVALLAGVAVAHFLLPAMRQISPPTLRRRAGRAVWPAPVLLGLILAFATASALVRNPSKPGGLTDLGELSWQERAAMDWVQRETSADARFLIVSGTPWEIDRNSEWLPVLANRKSVATVQGYEWRPVGEFAKKKREYVNLQGCATSTSQCLQDWARTTGVGFTHVYIPKSPDRPCCNQLRYSLDRDPAYRLIYDGPGAALFLRRRPLGLASE